MSLTQFAIRFFNRNSFALAEIQQPAHAPGFGHPRFDGTLAERFPRVGDDEIEIDVDDPAEAAAGFASAQGTVKRKDIRRRIAISDIAVRTMEEVAERLATPFFLRQEEIEFALAVMESLL